MSLNPRKKTISFKSLQDIAGSLLDINCETNPQISGIQIDSRRIKKGELFLAYPGENADGREFISAAIKQGVAAIFFEESGCTDQITRSLREKQPLIPAIPVKDLAKNAGFFAANFYEHPSQKMKVLGITGTNGKTTCSHLLTEAMTHLGKKSALIGTLGSGLWGQLHENKNTTPDPVSLQKSLSTVQDQGAEYLAMEVSSHGLDQGRVNGIDYHTAILTNLSRDHLDYHGTMERYIQTKEKLFSWPLLRHGILNVDDAISREVFERLIKASSVDLITVGRNVDLKNNRGIKVIDTEINDEAIKIRLESSWGNGELCNSNLHGEFNVDNLLLVLAALLVLKLPFEDVLLAMAQVHGVPGRMEKLGGGSLPRVFVDYAHTPDALHCALTAARNYTSEKVICVFGCGGNRDQGKRSEMGIIACKQADQFIVTADNPRYESVKAICQQILSEVPSKENCLIILDRADAIAHAISMAGKGDVVLVAGKGAEHYQEINGQRFEFSDHQIINAELARRAA